MSQTDSRSYAQSDTSTKDDKLDKVFWFKFIFSVIVGIAFGFLNFTGFISFAIYFFVSVLLSFAYFNKFVTNEEIDYQSEVFIEGLNVSIPSFLLCWILSYTLQKNFIQIGMVAESHNEF